MGHKKIFVARFREKDIVAQSLWTHIEETSRLAGKFASKIGLKKHGQLIGLLHDLGKASFEFQRYICSAMGLINIDDKNYVAPKELVGKLDHSTAGAQVISKYYSDKDNMALLTAQVLSLVIVSHHSGLIDCLTPDGKDNITKRLNKPDKKTRLIESEINFDAVLREKVKVLLSDDSIIHDLSNKIRLLREANDSKETLNFKLGLLIRYLFSCLIDADRLNTADFEFPLKAKLRNRGKYQPWHLLIEKLNEYLNKLEKESNENSELTGNYEGYEQVNSLRKSVSKQCLRFSKQPQGLYQLTVPTGGGKTLSSLRFALNHAQLHQLDRIFYIIPYTSIIDQNAEKAREALEDNDEQNSIYTGSVILEHHSNLTPDKETTRQAILSENWDAPIIFTTMVQFLETLFGYGTRSARRMHQLARSVIIFDEIQTLPLRCVHLFNTAIRFLIHNCDVTAVLCTATQPLLDRVKPIERALQITAEQNIIPNYREIFEKLKRVTVFDYRKIGGWTEHEISDLVKQELHETGSALVIVNTKKEAASLFAQLQELTTAKVFHLSTNMCPQHRLNTLSNIKQNLDKQRPVVCVSTQLIEAGVDINFGTVIRYLAGLDSIIQAAGRCNRNGAMSKIGRVYIINPHNENLNRLIDIKIGRDIAERVLDEFKGDPRQFDNDILGLKAMKRYYHYYFYERADEMCYKIDSRSGIGRSDNLFELLSTNKLSVETYKRINQIPPRIIIRQSFATAAKAFRVIESSTYGIVVPYGKGKQIINELCSKREIEKQYWLLRKAQRYSVNVYPYLFNELSGERTIHEAQPGSGIYFLDKQYYSNKYGMSKAPIKEMEFLNY